MATHRFASERFDPAIQILGEIRKQFAALGGSLPAFDMAAPGLLCGRLDSGWLAAGRQLVCVVQRSVHLLAYGKARPMEADPDRPRLQVENLRDLFGGQLLHVVQYQNDA